MRRRASFQRKNVRDAIKPIWEMFSQENGSATEIVLEISGEHFDFAAISLVKAKFL